MKNKIKGAILFLIGLGILVYLIWKMGVSFAVILSITTPQYVLLAMLLMLTIPMITALRMKYLLLSIGKKDVSLKKTTVIEYINKFLYNITPFRLNVPAKAVLLNKICDVKPKDSVSTVTFEYALDSSITLLIGITGAFLLFRNLPYISLIKIRYFLVLIFVCIIAFFGLPPSIFDKLLLKTELQSSMIKRAVTFVLKILKAIRETWVTLIFSRQMYYILPLIALMWIVSVCMTEALFLSMNNYVPLYWILVVMTCGVFVGGVTTIPGGLGAREATMVLLYTVLGIPQEISVVVVLVTRLLTIAPIIIGYTCSLHTGLDLIDRSIKIL